MRCAGGISTGISTECKSVALQPALSEEQQKGKMPKFDLIGVIKIFVICPFFGQ